MFISEFQARRFTSFTPTKIHHILSWQQTLDVENLYKWGYSQPTSTGAGLRVSTLGVLQKFKHISPLTVLAKRRGTPRRNHNFLPNSGTVETVHCYIATGLFVVFGGFPFGIRHLATPFPKGVKFLDSKNHHQSKKHLLENHHVADFQVFFPRRILLKEFLLTRNSETVSSTKPPGLHIFVDGRSAEPNRCDSSTDAIQKLIASNLRAKKKHTHRISSI